MGLARGIFRTQGIVLGSDRGADYYDSWLTRHYSWLYDHLREDSADEALGDAGRGEVDRHEPAPADGLGREGVADAEHRGHGKGLASLVHADRHLHGRCAVDAPGRGRAAERR